jgi:hypothetical protein
MADDNDSKSDGQKLLEQLLAVHNRFRGVAVQVDVVKRAIGIKASRKPALPDEAPPAPTKQLAFFEGLRGLVNNLEVLAGELERDVEELKRTF